MKKISEYMTKYWYAYCFAVVCMAATICLDLISPQITRFIIDEVILGGNLGIFPKLLCFILFVAVGKCIFQFIQEFIFDLVSSKIGLEMRKDLFLHIQKLSMNFFDKNNTGELMTRVKDDIDRIQNALGYVGMLIIQVVIHTSIVLFCMYRISPKLAFIPTIVMPIVGIFSILMERKLGAVYEEISEENAVLNRVAEENLAGVRTVKAFSREKFEIHKFLSHNQKYYELNMRQSQIFVRFHPLFQIITKLLPVFILLAGGSLVIQKELTLGDLGAFTEYSMNIIWPLEMIGWLSNDFSSAVASRKKLKRIYDEQPAITEKQNPTVLSHVKGDITFSHVSFAKEDGVEILHDISFHLEAGKTLGIMGATGAGKSSVIQLLQRLYDVKETEETDGKSLSSGIYLDGVNVKDLTLKQLRRNITLVMQDVFLFSDTIEENIKMGNKDCINEQLMEWAAENAQAASFIEQLPERYGTVIGERGVGLSGGQKQRISIARALSKSSPVLVMDDSTSALDMETEHQIQQALSHLSHTSKIIIAHRISAIRNADEILFLDNGRIAERGTHESLLALKGRYYDTFIAQYGNDQEEGGIAYAD